jgi:uncharacterized damage-inducible protein DinB
MSQSEKLKKHQPDMGLSMISQNSSLRINLLLRTVDEAFEKKAWHGPNLRGSLQGISATQAAWRPRNERHNIWEITLHTAYWKYAVCRRILGGKRGKFPLKGSNWFPRPVEATEEAWRADVRLLEETHASLREVIRQLPESGLNRKQGNTQYTNARLICGIAAHDVYHAGQIQLLKKLQSTEASNA